MIDRASRLRPWLAAALLAVVAGGCGGADERAPAVDEGARGAAAPAVPGAVRLAARHPEAGRPFVAAYGWDDYDATPENWTLAQDRRGVLYVGNLGGVLQYDGAAWRLTPLPNRTNVRALAVDADDRVWVGGHDDFGYLAPDARGQLQFVSVLEHVPPERRGFGAVWQAIPTDEGVYFLTDATLFRWDGTAMRVWPLETEGHNIALVDGTLYLMQLERGMLRVVDDALEPIPGGERFAGDQTAYFSLPFGDGRVLFGTRTAGLVLFDPAAPDDPYAPFPTEADSLFAEGRLYIPGAVLPGGRFAIGTRAAGLVVIDREGRLLHHIDARDGLRGDDVSYVFADQAGDVWLTHRQGISRVEIDAPLSYFDERAGLTVDPITVARHDGRLYVTTDDGLYRLEPGAQALRRVPDVTGQVLDAIGADGDLLVASSMGLYRLDGERLESVPLDFRDDKLNSVHRWSRDASVLFVSHNAGVDVVRKADEGWVLAGPLRDADGDPHTFAEAPDGALWVGTDVGALIRVDLGAGPPPFARAEGTAFGAEAGLPPGWVRPYVLDGEVLASTAGGRVFRFDAAGSRFVPDPTFDGVRSGHPLSEIRLHQASDGAVWVTQVAGRPAVLRPGEGGRRAASGWLGRLQDARIRAAHVEDDGVAWLLGTGRLVRYDARAGAVARTPPAVLFRRAAVGDRTVYGGAGPHVPVEAAPGAGPVRVEYAAARFGGTQFRTRLDGLEDGWSGWGPTSAREFTGLRPGDYRLEVQAQGVSGEPGPVAAYAFTVLPPWWQSGWAYVLYALVLGALAAVVARDRQRRAQLRHRLEMEHLEAETLRDLDRAKSQFFANVSHEFRTPLTLTLGPLDDVLAGEYGPVPEEAAEPIGLARRSAGRVLALINQILDVSKLEAGHTSLRTRRLDLGAFARAQAEAFVPLAAHRQIDLDVDAPGAPVEVWADPEHLGVVLANLLSNAFKFTPGGGRVTVEVGADGGEASVVVRDTGPGIAAADLPHIFDRFYQAEGGAGRPLGSGIGLALAHELTRLHGGTLSVESALGGPEGGPSGSAFTLRLPLGRDHLTPEQVDPSPWETAAAVPPRAIGDAPGPTPEPGDAGDVTTVLVVDDEPDIRAFVRRHLEGAGYRVVEAADGEEALGRVRDRLPDLVVSDVMMPRLDGLGLCRALRSDPETDFVPVLLLTAKAAPEDRLDGLAEACDAYLTKPFDVRELVARVDNLIALRRRLRERFAAHAGDGASGDRASAPPAIPSADDAFVEAVRAAIEAGLADDAFNVSALADAVGMSRSHLLRRTTDLLDATPSDLIRSARLDRAAELLAARAGTVSEVAYGVGFKSVAHFSNAFLAHTGARPSAYAEAAG